MWFDELVKLVETLSGEGWEEILAGRGGWARPLLMWAARRYGGMTLREVGAAVGGRDYTAVAMAIKRIEERASNDATLRRKMRRMANPCEM